MPIWLPNLYDFRSDVNWLSFYYFWKCNCFLFFISLCALLSAQIIIEAGNDNTIKAETLNLNFIIFFLFCRIYACMYECMNIHI